MVKAARLLQLLTFDLTGTPRNGEVPGLLNPHEQAFAALLTQQVADHGSKYADILAQRFVLGWKIDFFTFHRRPRRCRCVRFDMVIGSNRLG